MEKTYFVFVWFGASKNMAYRGLSKTEAEETFEREAECEKEGSNEAVTLEADEGKTDSNGNKIFVEIKRKAA